jgi:hypothetical protein
VSGKELTYYRAHFREAVQKDGVICLECGAAFKFLPQHLRKHAKRVPNFRKLFVVQLCFFSITAGLLVISRAEYSYADLTFHPTKQIPESLCQIPLLDGS